MTDGRTIASLAAEYGICHATVSNWIHAYREECQIMDRRIGKRTLLRIADAKNMKNIRLGYDNFTNCGC